MKNVLFYRKLLILICFPFVFFSCEKKMDEHYKIPDWIKGNVWEVLEDEGVYDLFLEGAERAGFRPFMQGKGIMTVMAPDDTKLMAYLNKVGYSTLEEIPLEELKKIIGYHLIYYAYTQSKMANFRPEGDGAGDAGKEILNPGMYYKYRTRSTSPTTTEYDKKTGKTVTIYHLERFLPIFSSYFFKSKKIDAKLNYEFFYPLSTWTGDSGIGEDGNGNKNDGFNASNASIKKYMLIASNGYIYTIDDVLEPLETIYDTMKSKSDYSDFQDLYDFYTSFAYDEVLSANYGAALGVDSLYLHYHGSLPPIALEWPTSYYQAVSTLASVSYSVFAPSNAALGDLFSRYWANYGYASLSGLDPLIRKHLIQHYVYQGSVVFPEEITNGSVVNSYGSRFNFDPYTVADKKMCVNGSFYGLDEIETPELFQSVAGNAFKNKDYASFLYILDGSSLLNTYASANNKFTMLMTNNESFVESGMELVTKSDGTNELQEEKDGGMASVSSDKRLRLVNLHTVNGIVELTTTGTQILQTQSGFNYWFVKDGKITCSSYFNNLLYANYKTDPFVPFSEVTNSGQAWINGKTYVYDTAADVGVFDTENSDGLELALAVCNDKNYAYFAFAQLLKKAGMVVNNSLPDVKGRFIVFCPTNDVISQALLEDKIPGISFGILTNSGLLGLVDVPILKEYMMNYFITTSQVSMSTYPYPGSDMRSGAYLNNNGNILNYIDDGTTLSIQLEGGNSCQVIDKYNYFPFSFSDGGLHLINSIF